MPSVLVVEDDPSFRESLVHSLGTQQFDILVASTAGDALGILDERNVDVVLTDLRIGSDDGLDLVRKVNERPNAPRTILMSAYASARDHQTAIRLGAVEVLCKPFSLTELSSALRRAVEDGFQGSLHGLSLLDLLQVLHAGRRSTSLEIAGHSSGAIHMRDGMVVHAECDGVVGEPAFRSLLRGASGSIRTAPLSAARRTIDRGFESLLLDSLRQLDEEDWAYAPEPIELTTSSLDLLSEEDETTPAAHDHAGLLDDDCARIVESTKGGLLCAVVDLDEGVVLGINRTAGDATTLGGIVLATLMDTLRGDHVSQMDRTFVGDGAGADHGGCEPMDVQISSMRTSQFIRVINRGRAAVMLVTSRNINLGMGWAALRSAVARIEPRLP